MDDLTQPPPSEGCEPNLEPRPAPTLAVSGERLLTEKEAARLLGCSHRTLQGMRQRGVGPVYLRLPPRMIRYSKEALDGWVAEGRK